MAIVQKFCCCGTLRSGAITAAVLNAISVALLLIGSFISFINASYYKKHGLRDESNASIVDGAIRAVQAVFGLVVLVFLCIGIHKRIASYLLPWIICAAISIGIWTIRIIAAVFITGVGLYFRELGALIGLLLVLGFLAFWIYLFLVVLSYYQILKEQLPGTVPMTEPGYVVCPAPAPAPYPVYPSSDTKTTPLLYPQVPADSVYGKPPAYTSV